MHIGDIFEDELEEFNSRFYRDIESWFSAGIACCDRCYDHFVSRWPAVYLRDQHFGESDWSLDIIYDGSRLRERYSREAFWRLVRQLQCPRCKEPFNETIWPYNFIHQPPENFEVHAAEIVELA